MTRMFYAFSVTEGTKDIRVVTVNEALSIIGKYIDSQKNAYDDPNEAIADSMFGFSLNKSDFIEICIDSKHEYRIRLECRYPRRWWFLPFKAFYQKEYVVLSVIELNAIVEQFFMQKLGDFKAYFDALPLVPTPSFAGW